MPNNDFNNPINTYGNRNVNAIENEQSLSFKNKRNAYVNDTNTFSYGNDAPINKFSVSLDFEILKEMQNSLFNDNFSWKFYEFSQANLLKLQ